MLDIVSKIDYALSGCQHYSSILVSSVPESHPTLTSSSPPARIVSHMPSNYRKGDTVMSSVTTNLKECNNVKHAHVAKREIPVSYLQNK
jgi:hypothetical protein